MFAFARRYHWGTVKKNLTHSYLFLLIFLLNDAALISWQIIPWWRWHRQIVEQTEHSYLTYCVSIVIVQHVLMETIKAIEDDVVNQLHLYNEENEHRYRSRWGVENPYKWRRNFSSTYLAYRLRYQDSSSSLYEHECWCDDDQQIIYHHSKARESKEQEK